MRAVTKKSTAVQIAAYVYDALGRRVRKTVSNGGLTGTATNGTTDCLYDGLQCIEERDGQQPVGKSSQCRFPGG